MFASRTRSLQVVGFTMPEQHGKALSLQEAVRRWVKPGMKLHLAAGIVGPSAAICEIIRQHPGKNPGFTLAEVDHPSLGRVKMVGNPISFSGTPVKADGYAPTFGKNTEEILSDVLGYDWATIEKLKDEEVI